MITKNYPGASSYNENVQAPPSSVRSGGSADGTTPKPKRVSEPGSWYPTQQGGLGLVARRSTANAASLLSAKGVEALATKSSMRLLLELPGAHPTVGLAQWNAFRLMFAKDSWGLKAYKPAKPTDPSAEHGEPDKEGDTSVADAIKQWPREIGGLSGLATTLASSLLYTGMAAIECVPFPEGEPFAGVRRVWPVDTLTIAFARPGRDADLHPYQLQQYFRLDGRRRQVRTNQWVPMNINTFFWTAIDQQVDDPFGLPPYGTAANEVLADLALMRDLRDAVHNAAWPRMKVGVNLAELHRVAVEVYRITNPKLASEWVQNRFDEVVAYVEALAPDENVVCDTTGKVEAHEPGSFTGLEGVLNFLRQRLVQALKSLPTLMGINDGSTYNYTSVEWAIYAAGLEALRDIVLELIARGMSLHLQLQGSTSHVSAWSEKIRTNDALVEANTEEVRIRNSAMKEALGYYTHDEAAGSITKRPAVKDADPDVLRGAAGAGAKADKDGSKPNEGTAGQGGASKGNNQNTNQEDREAKKK